MKELIINENETEQRLDRFLKKYLDKAPSGFIYRMIRKKNITLNDKRAKPEDRIEVGDKVTLFLADDTIEKFRTTMEEVYHEGNLEIITEDEHLIFVNKPAGVLSHGLKGKDAYEDNMVDRLINHLVKTKEYVPRAERTFRPAFANRLDRNTSGVMIGCKTYEGLKAVNDAIRDGNLRRLYMTIVLGRAKDLSEEVYMVRNEKKNKTRIVPNYVEGAKTMETAMKVIDRADGFSLVEVELFTGRTHQIRAQLNAWKYPILGDPKYGRKKLNKKLQDELKKSRQLLHARTVILDNLEGDLAAWNGKPITAEWPDDMKTIWGKIKEGEL